MAEVTASRPSDMETTFPVWDDAKVEDIINAEGGAPTSPRRRSASSPSVADADRGDVPTQRLPREPRLTDPTDPPPSLDADPKGDDGKVIDVEDGQVYPEKLEVYLKEWKRPETLLPDVPTVPVVLLKTPDGDGDDAAESAGDKGNRTLVDEHALYFGNPCVEWLFAAIRNVYERRDTVDAGSLLWENIYPQDDEGIPVASPNGKYLVRMWIMNAWRCVTVDDRVPVDVFGTLSSRRRAPAPLWPILLSKAILKLASRYGCLEREGHRRRPGRAVAHGLERECLGVDTTHGHPRPRVGDVAIFEKSALATAFLRERFRGRRRLGRRVRRSRRRNARFSMRWWRPTPNGSATA